MKSRAKQIKEEIDKLYKELFEIQKTCKHNNIEDIGTNYYCNNCAQPLIKVRND